MLKHLMPAALVLALVAIAWTDHTPTIVAQDEKPAEEPAPNDAVVSDRRPFNRVLTDEEVKKAIADAVEGDKDALQKLKDGRLGYMHILTRDSRSRLFAHQLMREEIGWVRDIQRWEAVLLGTDAALMETTFKELRDRFYHEHGQLARAIIKAHDLGDVAAAARMAKLAPDNPLVQACQAWTGEVSDTRKRIELLLAALDESMELSVWGWNVSPGLLDEDTRRLDYGSTEYIDAECELFFSNDGINRWLQIPSEWSFGNYFERLGSLAYELPEEERQQVASKILEFIGETQTTGSRYQSFEFGAWPEKKYDTPPVEHGQMNLAHSTVVLRYAKDNLAEEPLGRRYAALSTFWGQPDWEPGQAFLLQEALASGDAIFANLAMRAVLLVNSDSLRAISSVAKALAGAGEFKQVWEMFQAALKASGKKALVEIAQGKYPDTINNPRAGLDVAGQANLLKPFLSEDEIKTYHGLEAAWWMNRSQFLFAQHRMVAAMDAASHSIQLAAKASERKIAQANAYLTHRTMRSVFGIGSVPGWLTRLKERFPVATQYLQRQVEVWEEEEHEGIEHAAFAVERELYGGAVADDDQIEALKTDPSIAGGYGLGLVALTEGRSFNFDTKHQLLDRAERTAPTDWTIYFQQMPYSDWFGRFSGRDWTVAERLTQRLSLLMPYDLETFVKIATLLGRNGCNPRGMSPLLVQALNRPMPPCTGGLTAFSMTRLLFCRFNAAFLLQTNGSVNADAIPESIRKTYHGALKKTGWGLEWWEPMQWAPRLSPRGGFAMACFQNEYDVRSKENVGLLLDYALELQGTLPELSLQIVADAEKIGVSPYGHFVGSQTYIRAKAHVGEYDAAFKRWKELREGRVGHPPYLDYMLLHGMCEGNQWEHMNEALDHVLKYEQNEDSVYLTFALRRALMAAGRHKDVSQIRPPRWVVRSGDAYENANYTEVFYEARQLLEEGEYSKIMQRSAELNRSGAELSIGVILDSCLLRALASKLRPEGAEESGLDEDGMLHAINEDDFWWWRPSRTLDYKTLEVLVGRRAYKDLPKISNKSTWHGLEYGERPQAHKGAGLLREGEALARDDFVRGVVAFLADDHKSARTYMQACVDADQRCSHEYHVAEWLLDKKIPKQDPKAD